MTYTIASVLVEDARPTGDRALDGIFGRSAMAVAAERSSKAARQIDVEDRRECWSLVFHQSAALAPSCLRNEMGARQA